MVGSERTLPALKSQCSKTLSRSATLPGIGRGGCPNSGGLFRTSGNMRSAPVPAVNSTTLPSFDDGGRRFALAGSAGLLGGVVKPISTGTVITH